MNPWFLFPISVAFVVGIVIASYLWKREVSLDRDVDLPEGALPFEKTAALLTQYEHDLYRMLDRELRKDFYVLVKVGLGAAIELKKRVPRAQFYEKLIGNRRVDFLLCDRDTVRPLLAIQVVDPKESDRHEITENALASARIPFLKLSPRKVLAPSELTYLISEAIKNRKRPDGAAAEA